MRGPFPNAGITLGVSTGGTLVPDGGVSVIPGDGVVGSGSGVVGVDVGVGVSVGGGVVGSGVGVSVTASNDNAETEGEESCQYSAPNNGISKKPNNTILKFFILPLQFRQLHGQ